MSPILLTTLTCLLYAAFVSSLSIPQRYRTENSSFLASQTFDYVVVGGGTAGLIIAVRLSEQANVSVAVIEAGGNYELDHGNLSTVPAYWSLGVGTAVPSVDTNVYWGFKTEPQTVSLIQDHFGDANVYTVFQSSLHLPERKDAGRMFRREHPILSAVDCFELAFTSKLTHADLPLAP